MLNLPSFASAGYYVHNYRYFDELYPHEASTTGSFAEARYSSMSHIYMEIDKEYTDYSSLQKAQIFIEGSENDNSPWTVGSSRSYGKKAIWRFTGEYDEYFNSYFRFKYELYWMSGSTKIYVDTDTHEYTADQYFDNTVVSHYLGYTSLSSSKTYYMDITITLYVYCRGYYVSDFYDEEGLGGNKLNFEYMDFYYYVNTGPYF